MITFQANWVTVTQYLSGSPFCYFAEREERIKRKAPVLNSFILVMGNGGLAGTYYVLTLLLLLGGRLCFPAFNAYCYDKDSATWREKERCLRRWTN